MKTLKLVNNTWMQVVNPAVTQQERNAIAQSDALGKKSVLDNIKERSHVLATAEDALIANELYNANKIASSELISVEIYLPAQAGVINCRINDEHKQVRF